MQNLFMHTITQKYVSMKKLFRLKPPYMRVRP